MHYPFLEHWQAIESSAELSFDPSYQVSISTVLLGALMVFSPHHQQCVPWCKGQSVDQGKKS